MKIDRSSPDEAVSRRMAATRGRNNAGEKALRRVLHNMGLRYSLHCSLLPGSRRSVDITFPRAKVAVFVDGCFWHGCPRHGTWPRRNATWWREKIETNQRRDLDTNLRLSAVGWKVIRVWEHQKPELAARSIKRVVESRIRNMDK
jgi:DNA mismatch endonuclease (patch repair protein)